MLDLRYIEAFTFLMENIYVQFEGMVYRQLVGILTGTICAPLIADLFLFCYERDFMSNLHKSKRYDLIDMFNDTSRYLDDIFTIDNPEFEKHIPDVHIPFDFRTSLGTSILHISYGTSVEQSKFFRNRNFSP